MNTDTHTMKPGTAQASARVRVTGLGTPGCASVWSGLSTVALNLGSTWAIAGFQAYPRSVRSVSGS